MKRLRGFGAFFAILVCVAVAQQPASAQDADSQEVMRYTLTEAGLAKFTQAARNIAGVPGACAQEEDDSEDLKSIDQMVAKMNSVPGVQAAVQSAGMTAREYVVFMFSMMQNGLAAWAVSQPGGKLPPGVSQANVDFYKKHEAKMAALGKEDACGEDSGDEAEPEE